VGDRPILLSEEQEEFLPEFERLMEFQVLDISNINRAISQIGAFVDLSNMFGDVEKLRHTVKLADKLLFQNLNSPQQIQLYYFLANAWEDIGRLTARSAAYGNWETEEIENNISYLRRAFNEKAFKKLPDSARCRILTNLANSLDSIGRFVEAIDYYDMALEIDPAFAMAEGNRAYAICYYSMQHYDNGVSCYMDRAAYKRIVVALESGQLEPHAIDPFQDMKQKIERHLTAEYLAEEVDENIYSLGDSPEEQTYRKWCLNNRLFINPLNDITRNSIAATDVLCTPGIVVKLDEGLHYQGFYNQMKQEYVSGRYILYEGITFKKPHFSDKEVRLTNTLDYPAYSLGVEKVKMAFRVAYSIFDKIAFFLNDYLQLGISERDVSFKTLWYKKRDRKTGLRDELMQRNNWPLRGLFWLSKDLFENTPGFTECLEPEARELNSIRNYLEHKYLKAHDYMWNGKTDQDDRYSSWSVDKLAHSVYRYELEEKTMKLFKLVRAGLIYLSFAIYSEEWNRTKQRGEAAKIVSLPVDIFEDDVLS